MTRSELEHAIRAACDVSGDSELWVFGSQAILGSVPDAPAALRRSREVDVCPKNHPEKADLIDGALGELSRFDHAHGFYVHGLTLDGITLPAGWAKRTVSCARSSRRASQSRVSCVSGWACCRSPTTTTIAFSPGWTRRAGSSIRKTA